jgi:hypothetical protein
MKHDDHVLGVDIAKKTFDAELLGTPSASGPQARP